jgi:Bacterial CdiA-CT RNAse A domain
MQPDFDILRARSDAAAAIVIQQCKRISLILRGFNPNQARDEIGRWVYGGGGSSTERKPIEGTQVAQNGPTLPQSNYRVNLHEEEALGGHPITRHIGESRESILSKLQNEIQAARAKGDKGEGFILGTFTSVEAANKLVSSTLAQNPLFVDQVANGTLGSTLISARFASPTGFEAYAPNERSQAYVRDTYGVQVFIRHDKNSSKGYRVQTAYPQF